MLAIQTSATELKLSRAPSSPPMTATMEPSLASAARAMAAPRTAISFVPSVEVEQSGGDQSSELAQAVPEQVARTNPKSSSSW